MGIKGLLPFVNDACKTGNVSEFEGQHVAIDVSCLLHRGIFGCVEAIAHGKKTDFCIHFIQKYLSVFLHYKCKITLVFDGNPLPAKKEINDSRKERRESNQRLGNKLIDAGKNKEAYKVLRQGIGVPKEITMAAIKKGIDVIVAPYEADAQLAYLIQNKLVDAVVTQDSDLIVFGCSKIIFKLEADGSCRIFDAAKLNKCLIRPLCINFNFAIFRRICILSGCDYLDGGLPGVGLKKAEQFFAKTSLTDPRKFLPRVPGTLNLKSAKVTPKFVEDFIQAENTFLHQIVYDPKNKIQVPLTPYPSTKATDFVKTTSQVLTLSQEYWYAGTLSTEARSTEITGITLSESTNAPTNSAQTASKAIKRPSQGAGDIIERPPKMIRSESGLFFHTRPPKSVKSVASKSGPR